MGSKEYKEIRDELGEMNDKLDGLQEVIENNVINIYNLAVEMRVLYKSIINIRQRNFFPLLTNKAI